jgi:hypothetical protein
MVRKARKLIDKELFTLFEAWRYQEGERARLDNIDWSREPFITDRDLMTMSPWRVNQILSHPRWVRDNNVQGYHNKERQP